MSGLSLATVVVEAGQTSGARMQARLALRHNRPVFLLQSLLEHDWAQAIQQRPGRARRRRARADHRHDSAAHLSRPADRVGARMATVGELSDPYANFMRTHTMWPRVLHHLLDLRRVCIPAVLPGNANPRWLAAALPSPTPSAVDSFTPALPATSAGPQRSPSGLAFSSQPYASMPRRRRDPNTAVAAPAASARGA
jgi:hypothetical protein